MAPWLQQRPAEVFLGTLSRIVWAVVIPVLLVGALLTPEFFRGQRLEPPASIAAPATALGPGDDVTSGASAQAFEDTSDAEGPVDLYGNEVTNAIARYQFDATGSLYETHSPQTELPRLSSPKS